MGINGKKDYQDDFTTNATTTFLLETAAQNIRNMINERLVFSKRSVVVRKCCVYAVKPIVGKTPPSSFEFVHHFIIHNFFFQKINCEAIVSTYITCYFFKLPSN